MMRFLVGFNNESREVGKNPQVDVWRYLYIYRDICVYIYALLSVNYRHGVIKKKLITTESLLNSFTLSKDDSNSLAMQSKAKIIHQNWSRPC